MQGVKNMAHMPELWKKLGWTFLLLFIYRIGIHVPLPGIDSAAMAEFFKRFASNNLVNMFDLFSGGGLSQFSIFALGVMPYISSSIIMQLLQVLSPELKRTAREEGAAGRKKITQYTRYLTVFIAAIQSFGIANMIQGQVSPVSGLSVVRETGLIFVLVTVTTMTAGTMFLMWLGEQISSKGIGNGISLIIFAGIVASIPSALIQTISQIGATISPLVGIVLALLIPLVTLGIIFIERAQRRIPIHYAKRQQGRRIYGGQTTHLPLRLNTAGVIPPIFAGSLLMFPSFLADLATVPWLSEFAQLFRNTGILYNICYAVLIVFFCFFYTAIIFDPKDIAENLKKQGGFIPGIRPGDKTHEYIDGVLSRITLWGAGYITLVCLLPVVLQTQFGIPFLFGGTSVLIVVGVAMDFMNQVNSYMISKQYEGILGKAKLKGRY